MSEDLANPDTQQPGNQSAASQKPAAAKPPRSSTERIVVWGGIAALLVFAAFEARARFGYSQTLAKIQDGMRISELPDGKPLYIHEVDEFVSGGPSRKSGTAGVYETVTYKWKGLVKQYTLSLTHSSAENEKAVLSIETGTETPDHNAVVSDLTKKDRGEMVDVEEGSEPIDASSPMPAGGDAAGSGRGEGGGRRGGRSFDPMQFDADGDKKVSREEAPERMAQFFDRIDANKDGFIDEAEIAEMRQRREAEGGEGGARNRPEADTAEPATEPTGDSAPAESTDTPATEKTPKPAAPEETPQPKAEEAPAEKSEDTKEE